MSNDFEGGKGVAFDGNLPCEVSTAQVESYAKQLLEITRMRERKTVPKEAEDYIGEARAEMHDRLKAVAEINWAILNVVCRRETTDNEKPIQELNERIRRLVGASIDPAYSMSLISRIWRYLDDNVKKPYDSTEERATAASLQGVLNSHAKLLNLPPLSQDEVYYLCCQIENWKNGADPHLILKDLDFAISSAFNKANPRSRAARQVAKHRGENRQLMNQRVEKLRDIKNFLEKLFEKGRPTST